MSKIIVLFNLKPDVSLTEYEAWAKTTDLPTVNELPSVGQFEILKTTSLLGSEQAPPYQYIEIIDVTDDQQFPEDVSTEMMQKVAKEFQAFADEPMFIISEPLVS